MPNIEHSPLENERHISPETALEQVEKLIESAEISPELSPEKIERAEKHARSEALETAISVEAGGKEKKHDKTTLVIRPKNNRSNREKSFKNQMNTIQAEMKLPSRAFSKVIHNRVIEKTSDIAATTIARPNAILVGSICAFVLTLGVYIIAKSIGYRLSGFETIAAFITGWAVGIFYDYLRLLITGKK